MSSDVPRKFVGAYLWQDWPALSVGSCALIVSAFSNAYAPRAMGRVIDAFSRARGSDKCASRGELRRELIATALVFGIGAVASGLRVRLFARVLEKSVRRLKCDLYKACLGRRLEAFDRGGEEMSELTAIVEHEARVACSTYTEKTQNAVRYASSVLNGAINLSRLNGRLALELVCCVPMAALLLRGAGKSVSRAGIAASAADARSGERARDCLNRMRFVRTCASEGVEWRRFGALCENAELLAMKHGRARGAFHGLLDALAKTAVLGIVARGGGLVESGAMTAGDLLSFGLYAGYFVMGLAGLGKFAVSELATGNAAASKCAAVMAARDKDHAAVALLDGYKPLPSSSRNGFHQGNSTVELKDVWLTYNGKTEAALRGANLTVSPGQVHGLAGPSGAGKSSIIGLICGLYDADEGSVSVCGLNMASASPTQLADLRALKVATAEQSASASTFSGSLADAIAYPSTTDVAGEDLVQLAARLAAVDDVCENLGYDSALGDRGASLSGGQRARLAVARAVMLRHADLLLLDEPTAALDPRNEERLLDAVLADAKERQCSVLIVAHSAAAMSRCDTVSVLEEGAVVEAGTYADLIRDPESKLATLLLEQQEHQALLPAARS